MRTSPPPPEEVEEKTEREKTLHCRTHLRLYTRREGCLMCKEDKQRLLQQSVKKKG